MNTALLNEVKEYILKNPEDVDIGSWRKCVAGIALKLRGHEVVSRSIVLINGKYRTHFFVDGLAIQELELDDTQQENLFFLFPNSSYDVGTQEYANEVVRLIDEEINSWNE